MVVVNPPVGVTVFSVEIPLRREIRVPMRAGRRKLGFQPKCAQERSMGRDKVFPDGWMGFLEERMRKWMKMGEEPVRRGLEPEMAPDHLVVMVHGLVGSAEDWRFAAEQFARRLTNNVIVHCSECNSTLLTFDGVDLMGERLAEEVQSILNRRSGIRKISFVAHSLGGLIARYAIGRLYSPIIKESAHVNGTSSCKDNVLNSGIAGLVPMNFITFASPHLGSGGHNQLPFLCGLPFLERSASEAAHLIVGRTGKHLFLTDSDDGKPPLLIRMAGDDDIKFRSALKSFKRRVAYANANFDHMVGWRTSSIRRQHELPKYHLLVADENYPHIVYVDKGNAQSSCGDPISDLEVHKSDLEEDMIRGLTQLNWERVDVSFQNSKQRYIAHNTIQVKSYWLNSDGADVVSHMIDNFLI
ncbi:putative alpha/beta hydrolase protein [Dioscorea alata]|uniref:Alpha/beta hydrolase protein n=1 Tax=Dioscorea alata TaxID=55571 RepID=A0ACB7VDI8_DIOAL|nr:putative alpha/beta hydrolase protein [Dioscorea alata]